MTFIAKHFNELSPTELYEILKSRQEIFLLEQNIICQDLDGLDTDALHCFIMDGGRAVACLRAFYLDRDTVKIGRVLTLTHGAGHGRALMEGALSAIAERMPAKSITVSAQTQAAGYYAAFGFIAEGDTYIEDGIEHIKMTRSALYAD